MLLSSPAGFKIAPTAAVIACSLRKAIWAEGGTEVFKLLAVSLQIKIVIIDFIILMLYYFIYGYKITRAFFFKKAHPFKLWRGVGVGLLLPGFIFNCFYFY